VCTGSLPTFLSFAILSKLSIYASFLSFHDQAVIMTQNRPIKISPLVIIMRWFFWRATFPFDDIRRQGHVSLAGGIITAGRFGACAFQSESHKTRMSVVSEDMVKTSKTPYCSQRTRRGMGSTNRQIDRHTSHTDSEHRQNFRSASITFLIDFRVDAHDYTDTQQLL
jgi:hypothetical protein